MPLADVAVREDLAFEVEIAAGSFSDIDLGDSLTYTASLQDGTALPSWLQIDPAAGQFRGTAPSGAAETTWFGSRPSTPEALPPLMSSC
ncbi:MAG: putative Ig domain-containing protein [Gammaproteobacteria bacterium]